MSKLKITSAQNPMRGVVSVPADKSITHRALILGALAQGTTRIENALVCESTWATLTCLCALGANIEQTDSHTLVVHGRGLHSLREPGDTLFCKGSGTTMRLLAGVCAGQRFFSLLDGTTALRRRPMARVIEPLQLMGAQVLAREGNRLPPVAIRGDKLRGIDYGLPVASAQVKSALLLAGLAGEVPVTLREPAPSRDHTERMLDALGVKIKTADATVQFTPISAFTFPSGTIEIPNDFSSAAFFIVAALFVSGSEIRLTNVGINPTRTGLLDVLARMGAEVRCENQREVNNEPRTDLVVRAVADGLRPTTVEGAEIPRLIDELPILAVLASQANGTTVIRDADELRVKESDRISVLASELRKLGVRIEEQADGFAIEGPSRLLGTRVEAHSDHRLAMSLAVAGLIAKEETVIEGWECVADSFPDFERVLAQALA